MSRPQIVVREVRFPKSETWRRKWTKEATARGSRQAGERNFSIWIEDGNGQRVSEEFFFWALDRASAIRKVNRELHYDGEPSLGAQLRMVATGKRLR